MSQIQLPADPNTNLLMLFRWLHFIGGVAWLGLLYFFNLVNVPFMKELDAATKGKVLPSLMSRALWWFRWASVLTVLMGLAYWGVVVASEPYDDCAGWREVPDGSVIEAAERAIPGELRIGGMSR